MVAPDLEVEALDTKNMLAPVVGITGGMERGHTDVLNHVHL